MSRRIVISEEEKNEIKSKYGLLKEQNDEETYKANKAWQAFLKGKGLYNGEITPNWNPNAKAAMKNYQNKIGANPDGNWGRETTEIMKNQIPADFKKLEDTMYQYGDIFDKFLHFIGIK